MKIPCLILLSLLFILKSAAQQFYTANHTNVTRVTLTGSNSFKTLNLKHKDNADFTSIAIFKSTLYFNDFNALYKATIKQDSIVNIQKLVDVDYYPTSLTVDESGVLFFAIGAILYKYDAGILIKLGTMPYQSAGDLLFYKGSLYMASLSGIVKVNTSDPASSIMHISTASSNILGLTSVAFDCKTNKVYGFETITDDYTRMLEIDLDQKIITTSSYFLSFHVSDAGSTVETGAVTGISVDSINILPQCGTNKANVTINSSPYFQQFTYKLDGNSNNTGIFTNLISGKYNFSVSTANGCVKDSFVVVPDFNFKPQPIINKTDPICGADGSISLNLNNPAFRMEYNGDIFTSTYIFEKLLPGNYTFGVINKYNCWVDTIVVTLNQNGPCGLIIFPTAFTPNNDGINDTFRADQATIAK